MRIYFVGSIIALSLLLGPAVANGFDSHSSGTHRINVYSSDRSQGAYHHTGPIFSPDIDPSPCFPYKCGGISGPFTNPDPDARKPENLTACMYDVTGTLVYEREEKVCSNKYINQNQIRVEGRSN